ncbi:MAG: hypothetical protein E6I93_19505, partial [Chloroflexi bacterium]
QYGSCIICALDHGMTSPNFLDGLYDTRKRTREAIAGGANVFMLGRGISRQVVDEFTPATSLALMLSASAAGRPQGSMVTPIGSVDEALRLGADAVVVYVALAGENESEMIQYASQIGEASRPMGRTIYCAMRACAPSWGPISSKSTGAATSPRLRKSCVPPTCR